MQDTPHLQPSYTTILHPINILIFNNIRYDWCRMADDLSIQSFSMFHGCISQVNGTN